MNSHRLDEDVEARRRAARTPGLAVAVVRGQEVVYASGFGTTSAEEGGVPVTPRTVFRIASTTKPLTGTAVMRLVGDGLLELDRPVRDYLPWLACPEPSAAAVITLRLLLSHTAGLPGDFRLSGSRDPGALRAWVRDELSRYRLLARPGERYEYSNPGLCLAGYLAEAVAGKPYADLMQQLVFDPLGMRRTTFEPTVAMTYPLAQGHYHEDDGSPRARHRFSDNAAGYPAAFAFSTVLDLAAFAVVHLNEGRFRGERILSPEAVTAMHMPDPATRGADGDEDGGHGLTFGTGVRAGTRYVEHDGEMDGFRSQFLLAPDLRVAVVVLANAAAPESTAATALRVLDEALAVS
jgi:CubicO group peptidase (beta-lactamase class C family)